MNNTEDKQVNLKSVVGDEVEVFLISDKGEKTSEVVKIKELPFSKHEKATKVFGTWEWINLCTGKEKEWIDQLTESSYLELIKKCDEVNEGFFGISRYQSERIMKTHSEELRQAVIESSVSKAMNSQKE